VKSKDLISSLFWMALGAGVCYGGIDLELGTLHDPGSGFMFFWLGIIMVGLSFSIGLRAMRAKAGKEGLKEIWAHGQWRKIISVLLALSLYAYSFNFLGFILGTVFLLLFLFKSVEPQRWSVAVLGAILSTLTAYLVFQKWLGTQLPKGFLDLG